MVITAEDTSTRAETGTAKNKKSTAVIPVVIAILAMTVFIVDLQFPLGVAGGVPYVAVVLAALWCSRPRSALIVTAWICTVLTVLGYFLSSTGGIWWMVLVNCLLAIFAIWVTAILSLQRVRDIASLQRGRDELEQRVQKRTVELDTANEILEQEIEEHERAEVQLKKLSSAIEQTADLILITDRDGLIEFVNPAFEQLTGYSIAEVIGLTPRFLKSGQHEQDWYEDLWNTILSGDVFRAVFINRKKNGELYHEGK